MENPSDKDSNIGDVADIESDIAGQLIEQMQAEIEFLKSELADRKKEQQEKDTQISELHQLLAMQQKYLENQHRLLEDMRNRSLWRRLKGALGVGSKQVSSAEYSS